ncbi:MAG: gamma carbonic anhydrase family protein [Chloroflexota bacterium]|nr:gamma carbonic anhydrase family protein [Chloroflexota bacterium]
MIKTFNGKTPQIAESAFVSEWAYLVGDVVIGENSSVWPGAVIRGDVGLIKVGNNSHVEDNTVIHGPSDIGNNVIIGHGAVVHALKMGNKVLVGMNATIIHGTTIGDECIIAGGAVVTERMNIPSGSFVAGVPAQVMGEITEKQRMWIDDAPTFYTTMAQAFKEQGL